MFLTASCLITGVLGMSVINKTSSEYK